MPCNVYIVPHNEENRTTTFLLDRKSLFICLYILYDLQILLKISNNYTYKEFNSKRN